MSARWTRYVLAWTYVLHAQATPGIELPFNSQVPDVARVGQAYSFQLSISTFSPDATNYTYSLSDQPAWLTFDSDTLTLIGTPGASDTGAETFTLTAADESGAALMDCTLVVSSEPAPKLEGDISKDVGSTVGANFSSGDAPVVTILASKEFKFSFQQSSFIDIVQRQSYYYATLADHTPLPSWLDFDAQSLTFSGSGPVPTALPLSWEVLLIASDVAGFAGAQISFTIAIGTQQLAFVPASQQVNISAGMELDITNLQEDLARDGSSVNVSSLSSAVVSPELSWLHFDSSTLSLTGTVPSSAADVDLTVTVTDAAGEFAIALIKLVVGSSSLLAGNIGTLSVVAGKAFNYTFQQSLFSESDVTVSVVLPPSASWLQFDPTGRELEGVAPFLTAANTIIGTLTARSPSLPTAQTQTFEIEIETAGSSTATVQSTISSLPTGEVGSSPSSSSAASSRQRHLKGGVIAAIVLTSLIVAAAIIACLILCCRLRRRRREQKHDWDTPRSKKDAISEPLPVPGAEYLSATRSGDLEDEKTDSHDGNAELGALPEPPPQIALDLPMMTEKRRSRWLSRLSRVSQLSSIGIGEEVIVTDDNIPEWGRQSTALQTPHDSFYLPTEIARMSQGQSQTSPSKGALQRLRDRNHPSRRSTGLAIDTRASNGFPSRHASRHGHVNHVLGSVRDESPPYHDRSSTMSNTTMSTSVLSTRDSDFPRPPTRSSYTMSRSLSGLIFPKADNCQSIRLVSRSDSVSDDRPLADKRQSFIRNRASTSIQSPLFSHGSRVSCDLRNNGQESIPEDPSTMSSAGRVNNIRTVLGTHSHNSSVEHSPRKHKRFSQRIRASFGPEFPRAVTRDGEDEDFYTIASSDAGDDLAAQLALPLHERTFVLPGEASPTPPPQTLPSSLASRRVQARSRVSPLGGQVGHRSTSARHKQRLYRSTTPLSLRSDLQRNARKTSLPSIVVKKKEHPGQIGQGDPSNTTKQETQPSIVNRKRPRLRQINSERPVSVENVRRLSSTRADTGTETDGYTQAGSVKSIWAGDGMDLDGTGLMSTDAAAGAESSRFGTQRSDVSGPMFL